MLSVVIILIVTAFAVPLMFKKEIIKTIKLKANETIEGKLDFQTLDISLFKNFPKWTITLGEPSLISYVADTTQLFASQSFSAEIDFWNLITKTERLEIKGLSLIKPQINLIQYPDGRANYQLLQPSANNQKESAISLSIRHYRIEDGDISYRDSSLQCNVVGLNHEGSIDLSDKLYDLRCITDIERFSLASGSVHYFSNARLSNHLKIKYDEAQQSIEMTENLTRLNALSLELIGKISKPDSLSTQLDLKFKAPGNEFSELFSLVPKAFTNDYKDLNSSGRFSLAGEIKGIYNGMKKQYPHWKIECIAENGSVQYRNMPVRLDQVNLKFYSENTTDDLSNAFLQLNPMDFMLNQRLFHIDLSMRRLYNNPQIETAMKGSIDLKDIKGLIPSLKETELSGVISTDVDLSCTESQVIQEQFDQIRFGGYLSFDKIRYKPVESPAIEVNTARLDFSPQSCKITQGKVYLGKSDLLIDGELKNPLALIQENGKSNGLMKVKGSLMDANEWLSAPEQTESSNGPSTVPALVKRIALQWKAEYDLIRYEDYQVKNASAEGNYSDDRFKISTMKLNVNGADISGTMEVEPLLDFAMNDKILKGNVNLETDYFDADNFMNNGNVQTASQPAEPFLVPKGMDLNIKFKGKRVKYSKLDLADVVADLNVIEDELQFNQLSTSSMGGKMLLSGIYNTSNPQQPKFDMKYDMKNLQFARIFESIKTFSLIAPIAKFIEGQFNSAFLFSGSLDKNMSPDLTNINIKGIFETINAAIKNYKPIEAISSKLNIKELKNLNLKNTKNYFTVENGTVTVKELTTKISDLDLSIAGTTRIQGPMDFNFKIRIPRNKLNAGAVGEVAESGIGFLKNLASKAGVPIELGSHVNVLVNMKGALLDPSLSFKLLGSDGQELGDQTKSVVSDVADKVKDSLNKRAEQEIDKAKEKALKEAQRVEDSLKKVAAHKIEEEKSKILDKAASEASKHVDSALVNKGKEILKDKGGKKVDEILKDSTVDQIKDKMKDWNPFKKKK